MPLRSPVVPELGTILGGKYRILRVLGQGGMGVVYEAENLLTLKRAAIKRLHAQLLAHDDAYHRVLHEARASARIRHRNVVDVYDVLRDDDSICLVMELLIGEPLSALIARGGLTLTRFIALLLPAMRGLEAAHAVGVIHRDIKPENIFLQNERGLSEPVPKVIDFGISKVIDPEAGPHLTRSGITMGTPKYVSYEQLAGAKDVDERADVYAIGVMLYEALTGRPPYEATSFGQQAIRFATTVPRRARELRPEVSESFDALVMNALARDREERTANMQELLRALTPYADPEGPLGSLPAFPERSNMATVVGVGPALTTTPMHSTPVPASVPSPPRDEPPASSVATSPASEPRRARRLVLVAVALLLAAGAVALLVREPEMAQKSAPPAAAPPAPALAAPRSAVAATATEEPPSGALREAAGELAKPDSPPPSAAATTEPSTKVHSPSERPSRAQLVERSPKATRQSPKTPSRRAEREGESRLPAQADSEAQRSDDTLHRAGRVTRDQF